MAALDLRYLTLEARKNRWVREVGVEVQADWLPFHFAYHDLFIGLQFAPLDLGWRRLATISDLFELCFQFSLILWLVANDQTNDPRGLALSLFGIPPDFRTDSLSLRYLNRCSDPLARVISFNPTTLPLQLYRDEDYRTLIEWYDFDLPDYHVLDIFQGLKMVGYISRYNVLIERYQWSYDFYALARQEGLTYEGAVNRAFLKFALPLLSRRRPTYTVLSKTKVMSVEEYKVWELVATDWIVAHLEWIMLYHASVNHYIGLGFINMNTSCRNVARQNLAQHTRRMLQLITRLPPLPANVVVSRGLRGDKFNNLPLGLVHTEDGFFSTSLVGLAPSFFSTNAYLYLNVPAGIPVIAMLAVNNRQQELLFPPGTRYILRRREVVGGIVNYYGEILL